MPVVIYRSSILSRYLGCLALKWHIWTMFFIYIYSKTQVLASKIEPVSFSQLQISHFNGSSSTQSLAGAEYCIYFLFCICHVAVMSHSHYRAMMYSCIFTLCTALLCLLLTVFTPVILSQTHNALLKLLIRGLKKEINIIRQVKL